MFFVFGWGKKSTKDFGPCLPNECPNCHNKTMWHLLFTKKFFTLFFIPIIPYDSKYYLLCDICNHGIELQGNEIGLAKELCLSAKKLEKKEISFEEFQEDIIQSGLISTKNIISPNNFSNIPKCPDCGMPFNPTDYDPNAIHIYCSACSAELPRY